MSEGQRLALRQLEAVAAAGAALEIVEIHEPAKEGRALQVDISIDCSGMEQREEGIRLHQRERLMVFVEADFPWSPPSAWSTHRDWAGTPHVQWGRSLCIYASVATEWRPEEGAFGFLERLTLWLEKAAIGELDPAGAPLHPPVAYRSGGAPRLLIHADAPEIGAEAPWVGFAEIKRSGEDRVDLIGWTEDFPEDKEREYAPTVLLPRAMDWEYPTTTRGLLDALAERGVPWKRLLAMLRLGSVRTPKETGMPLVVGTPMRRGADGDLKQHLTAWYLSPVITKGIRLSLDAYSDNEKLREIGEEIEQIISEWADAAEVAWCGVDEQRPEVTERRDSESSVRLAFEGKKVALWGCGAIGGHVAEWLARAGVRELVLYDNDVVSAGVLTRQPFVDADIGRPKAKALAEHLRGIAPELEVDPRVRNVLNGPLSREDWTEGAEIVIDATAATAVAAKLEYARRTGGTHGATLIGFLFGHTAERGLCVVSPASHCGGTADLMRRTMLSCLNGPGLEGFADEFWPDPPRSDLFQPEPGCSEPTFRGSGAEVAALAGALLTSAAAELVEARPCAHLVALPSAEHEGRRNARLSWEPDVVLGDGMGRFEIRISAPAMRTIDAWISRNARASNLRSETGGVLFGQRDLATGVLWVDEASGPPPDSVASPEEFVCGTEGVQEQTEERRARTRRATTFVGMWHTHPDGRALPSPRDVGSMAELVSLEPLPEVLMLICGESAHSRPERGAYVFAREDLPKPFGILTIEDRTEPAMAAPPRDRDVGLALSGGGSRAIAFHLGCLRALRDRGTLERVRVVSGVSGGSVAAAAYAYSEGSFADFDASIEELLIRGLQGEIMRRAILSPHAFSSLAASVVSGGASLGAKGLGGIAGRRLQAPIPRWASRTDALEATLAHRLFGERDLTVARREDIDVIINACDLRTGSAARFGSRESGIWRLGRFADPVAVATAVAASAAYPLLLPNLDRKFEIERRDGSRTSERVLLTDGGIFDNLGTSCLEPGRSEQYSYNVFEVEQIVACDAGRGLLADAFPVGLFGRMGRSFEATHRKVQDASRGRLHSLATQGQLAGFAMPYLGQQDKSLPWTIPDLVPRSEVVGYPTNFASMRQADLDRIALRGEQLTHQLVERWCPGL